MTNYSIIEILANVLNKLLKLYKSHQVKEAWLTISLLWRMIHLFNSLIMKWLICNLSLQHQYIIQYTGDENSQTYPIEVVILI